MSHGAAEGKPGELARDLNTSPAECVGAGSGKPSGVSGDAGTPEENRFPVPDSHILARLRHHHVAGKLIATGEGWLVVQAHGGNMAGQFFPVAWFSNHEDAVDARRDVFGQSGNVRLIPLGR